MFDIQPVCSQKTVDLQKKISDSAIYHLLRLTKYKLLKYVCEILTCLWNWQGQATAASEEASKAAKYICWWDCQRTDGGYGQGWAAVSWKLKWLLQMWWLAQCLFSVTDVKVWGLDVAKIIHGCCIQRIKYVISCVQLDVDKYAVIVNIHRSISQYFSCKILVYITLFIFDVGSVLSSVFKCAGFICTQVCLVLLTSCCPVFPCCSVSHCCVQRWKQF